MSPRVLTIAAALGLTVVSGARAAQEGGSLTLADRRLVPGSTVPIAGARLPAGTRLAFALKGLDDRVELGSLNTGPEGTLADSLSVPAGLTPGAYRLEARTAGGEIVAGLDVAILASAGPPSEGAPDAPAPAGAHDTSDHDTTSAPGPRAEGTILGYDWPRLHAALNDLPAALLLVAVGFEIAGLLGRRASLRAAGFWTLLVGTAGTVAAVVAGLQAEDVVAHDDLAHTVMERHQTLGLVTVGVFATLAIWRVVRRRSENRRELAAWSVAGLAGAVLLVITSQLGGSLMFDHALGVPSPTLRAVLERRGELMPVTMPAGTPADSSMADSAAPGRPHRDRPGAAPHKH